MSNRLIFTLSLLGLIVSAFLAFEYLQIGPIVCPITGSGCELVRKSNYSKLLGIDLPYFGILFYIAIASLSIWLTQTSNKLISRFRFLISFSGVVFGIYLTILEAFVIQAWCIWCLTSFVISFFIFLICLKELFKKKSASL